MHIAVVGAGLAGLTAAHRLRQAGHHVEVLESRDVVGGRTHAERFGPGHHCDTGAGVLDYVMQPMFEGPFFSRMHTFSAAMVRAWLGALHGATFYQVDGGMDVPWLRLAETLDIRTGEPVETVQVGASGVELIGRSGARRYTRMAGYTRGAASAGGRLARAGLCRRRGALGRGGCGGVWPRMICAQRNLSGRRASAWATRASVRSFEAT